MTKIYCLLVLCAALNACSPVEHKTVRNSKPNILFIATDEQQDFTMRAYGNDVIQTPSLDKLASESYVFRKTYCTWAVCSPSRSSVLTGLYPHITGVVGNNVYLADEIKTLPEIIDDPDYRTAYMGKWHLGDEIFAQHGFETWVSMEDGYNEYYRPDKDPNARSSYFHWLVEQGYEPNTKDNQFSRSFAAELPIQYCKPKFLEVKAIEYLEKVKDEPFILYVEFLEPHPPFFGPLDSFYHPDEVIFPGNFKHPMTSDEPLSWREKVAGEVAEKYDTTEQGWHELKAKYWGLVTQVDMSVGAILDKLDALGLSENTIVVYTSDHGEMMGSHGLAHKGVHYEEAARIPFLLKVPWLNKSEKMIEERVSQIDVVPTLLDLLGLNIPGDLQGESLMPALRGGEWEARDIFIQSGSLLTVVTTDNWKLILSKNDRSLLFDLNSDPLELNNLFYHEEYRDTINRLAEIIYSWQSATNHQGSFPVNFERK